LLQGGALRFAGRVAMVTGASRGVMKRSIS
jgi:hypothetical protein